MSCLYSNFLAVLTAGLFLPVLFGCGASPESSSPSANEASGVQVVPQESESRVDVLIDGELFTSYIFEDSLEVLKKPVLYPINTVEGTSVTRGYPIEPRPGERVDHPHHIGHWFNYGDVNGLDFWNNSSAVSKERQKEMGHIVHQSVNHVENGSDKGVLEVTMDWLGPNGKKLLQEDTRFVFRKEGARHIIDRTTKLTAVNGRVTMHDNKEGAVAIRVRRELEHPADDPIKVVGDNGKPAKEKVLDNKGVSGEYLNADGVTGMPVWGKRSPWVALNGVVEGDSVSVVILDHPDNVGYPTYWHARGYGLFSANPLGQEVFSDGEQKLRYELADGESTTFRYRILVHSGSGLNGSQMKAAHQQFVSAVQ